MPQSTKTNSGKNQVRPRPRSKVQNAPNASIAAPEKKPRSGRGRGLEFRGSNSTSGQSNNHLGDRHSCQIVTLYQSELA